ncbi:hypothetical protein K0U00_24520, partial [Paenibacillus sepulcri]|nr:hypothetical protein [Paenibacillus sepulcri]
REAAFQAMRRKSAEGYRKQRMHRAKRSVFVKQIQSQPFQICEKSVTMNENQLEWRSMYPYE